MATKTTKAASTKVTKASATKETKASATKTTKAATAKTTKASATKATKASATKTAKESAQAKSKAAATKTAKATRTSQKQKGTRSQTAQEKALSTELEKILPELDAEGLQFLLDQARVHLYNMQIDRMRAEAENEKIATRGTSKTAAETCNVEIKRGQNSDVYHIVCNGHFSMFNSDEMLSIVRICHGQDDDVEKKSRLYHWFFRERRDFLNDNGIADIHSQVLDMLYQLVKKRFKI